MRLIYNLGIRIFILILKIASLRNPKAKKWIVGRKGLLKIIKKEQDQKEQVVWVHCASLGEFEQGRPLIEEIKRNYPDKKILLTFFSPSGYEVRKDYGNADYIYYLPADTPGNARRFIKYCNPEVAFFVKYEYWYNYLSTLKKKSVPVYFVSSIFRKDQLFFKGYGKWYRKMLKKVTHFFLQNQESAELLKSLNINNFSVVGDTRFDRVAHILENIKPIPAVEQFLGSQKAIIAGSSWKAEEALLMQYNRVNPGYKLIIVPHEVSDESIQRIKDQFGESAICFSKITSSMGKDKNVLIIDSYGLLNSLYQYGYIAIVGGGFGVGIHNILEAATFGMPVIIGPNYERFQEAVDMVNLHCTFPVANIEDFNTVMNHLLKDTTLVLTISKIASDYVKSNVGATPKILDFVFNK
jgi:3-deoxy-D-manno-octulosonic-acid transferase